MDSPQLLVCVSDRVGSLPGSSDHSAALSPQSRSVHAGWSYRLGNTLNDTFTTTPVAVLFQCGADASWYRVQSILSIFI